MFTGIVQGTAPLVAIDEKPNFRTHVIEMPAELLPGLELGASVAHNGCCLTVTAVEGNRVSFDLIKNAAPDQPRRSGAGRHRQYRARGEIQ